MSTGLAYIYSVTAGASVHVLHTDSSAGEMRADGEAATGDASGKRLEDACTRHFELFYIV